MCSYDLLPYLVCVSRGINRELLHFPSFSERHNKIAMAAVCAGHLVGQTGDWKYSFNQTFPHILAFLIWIY